MSTAPVEKIGALTRFLNGVERLGNRLPHITMLFIYALIIAMICSFLLSFVEFDYIHPNTGKPIEIINIFEPQNLVLFIEKSVSNFMGFPPLGITIVVTLGIGIAEGSGFIHACLRKLLSITPKKILTPAVVFISILCHVASDSAYTVLMPVSALMFYCCGRHPLAGIACSFAGLAGGFTASFTPSMIDPVMQSFTEAASHIIDPDYSVNVLCNYFYALGGTIFVILACWFVTDKIVEPRLNRFMPVDDKIADDNDTKMTEPTARENRAFVYGAGTAVGLLVILFLLCYPDNSIMRAENGSLTAPTSPVMKCLVPFLFIFFALPGLVYGFAAGTYKCANDVIHAMENIMRMLISFMVFCFFAGQFLYVFGQSQIGSLLAIAGAEFLRDLGMPSGITLFGIIILTGMLNILITSATSKWAILSTIFVPMLMMLGLSPELTQAAFRVSDSAVNVATPLFPFYPLLIMYCQKYCSKAGVGTLCSMMIPYTAALLIVLTCVLYAFWFIGIPIGFNSGFDYPSTMFPQP